MTCQPSDTEGHDFPEDKWGPWYHLPGTESIYRDRSCRSCGLVETVGGPVFDESIDPAEVEVSTLRPGGQNLAEAIAELVAAQAEHDAALADGEA